MPQLEQNALYERVDFSVPATDRANQEVLNTTVPTFVCPSTSTQHEVVPDIFAFNDGKPSVTKIGTAARSDYEVIGGVSFLPSQPWDLHNIKFGAWGEPRSYFTYPLAYRKPRLRDISDGLSKTLLIAERGGRPDWYRRGMPVEPYPYSNPSVIDHHQAAWGISTHFRWLVFWHEQSINESNATGIYSFHTLGANVGLADGSVRFLLENIDQELLNALATRSTGDTVTLD